MSFERLLNKEGIPSENDIDEYIGSRIAMWKDIHEYMSGNYDFLPELAFFTKKYGWTIRYKRKGKTLCYFFPEKEAFSILIVLGNKESDRVIEERSELNKNIGDIFDSTEQLRDGRWLWLRILNKSDIESFKILLTAKKRPTG